jgi:RNA polymerase sigma-70 factor (ECF subfamily)
MATQVAVGTQLNTQVSEDKLIRAGQRGDHQAVETLFRRYQRPLFQTALRVLGNAEDAEDALQDGMLSAYRNLKRFEGRSQFSTWLTRIVINAALMRRRSAKSRPAVSLDETPREDELPASERFADDGPNPEQVFASTEIREMISENLDELSLCAPRLYCAKCRAIRRAKRRRNSASRKILSRRGCGARGINWPSGWDHVCGG